jgi:hypothetical protein
VKLAIGLKIIKASVEEMKADLAKAAAILQLDQHNLVTVKQEDVKVTTVSCLPQIDHRLDGSHSS